MFGYHEGGYGMMGGFAWIFTVIVIILLVYVFNNKKGKSSKKSAKDILDERYAKGEIDLEEYNEKKKNLNK